jgi:hypothetical protein
MSDEPVPMPPPAEYPRMQRQPCPHCQSRGTIQLADDGTTEKRFCPEWTSIWRPTTNTKANR